jgi:hypothetical protein
VFVVLVSVSGQKSRGRLAVVSDAQVSDVLILATHASHCKRGVGSVLCIELVRCGVLNWDWTWTAVAT